MERLGIIYYDGLEFEVEVAQFGYVRTSHWGAGWNFLIGGFCTASDRGLALYPHGLMLYSEAAPLPLDPEADLLTQVVEYSRECYEAAEWDASWFECWTEGHNQTWEVKLEFVERTDSRYRVDVSATVGDGPKLLPLKLSAWCEYRPVQDRPTGFGLAPRRGRDLSRLRFVEQIGHQLWTSGVLTEPNAAADRPRDCGSRSSTPPSA
jgi:hypothetical protein